MIITINFILFYFSFLFIFNKVLRNRNEKYKVLNKYKEDDINRNKYLNNSTDNDNTKIDNQYSDAMYNRDNNGKNIYFYNTIKYYFLIIIIFLIFNIF